jgi:hypothetical protein
MKLKVYPIIKSLLFVALVAVFFSSCKKDDPDPEYAGTWVTINSLSDGSSSVEMKELIILSAGKFEQIVQLKNPSTNQWVNYIGFKGTFTTSEKKLNITIVEAGMSAMSPITQLPNGQIEYIKSTDGLFTEFLEAFETPETFTMEYEVNGNEITFKSDYNDDKDYNDAGETRTYTRQ